MSPINTEQEYDAAVRRIEELLAIVGNNTPRSDKNFVELDALSDLVAGYEEVHYPVRRPTLVEAFLSGKSEPKVRVSRKQNKVFA